MQSLFLNFFLNHLKPIRNILIAIIIILIIILITIPIIRYLSSPSLINIQVVPTTAIATIDGQEYHQGVSEINPGTYTMVISNQDYQSKTIQVEIKNHQTTNIQDYLLCKDGTMNCYKKDVTSISLMQDFTFDSLDETFTNFMNSYNEAKEKLYALPVHKYFFINNSRYYTNIKNGSSSQNCPANNLCLLIDGSMKDYQHAKEVMRENNIDPDFYTIIYEDSMVNSFSENSDINPIFYYLPYDDYNSGIKVSSSDPVNSNNITLDVYLYTCDKKEINNLKSHFLSWISGKNLNLNNYSVNYSYCNDQPV